MIDFNLKKLLLQQPQVNAEVAVSDGGFFGKEVECLNFAVN